MAFFDKLNIAARNAAKTASDLANDAIGAGRIAVKIKREELEIQEQYEKIGEYYYKKRNEGMEIPKELEECCVAIDIALATIKELEEEREEMRDNPEVRFEEDIPYTQEDCQQRICPSCGGTVTQGALFCSACGSKMPDD